MQAVCEAHHWIIETWARDGHYHGRCKRCGAEGRWPRAPKQQRVLSAEERLAVARGKWYGRYGYIPSGKTFQT